MKLYRKVRFSWRSVIALFFLFVVVSFLNVNFIILAYESNMRDKQIRSLVQEFERVRESGRSFALDIKTDFAVYDARSANLKRFIRRYYPQSPLYELTDYIVEVSDRYGLDYRLLVAIAMQESNLCRRIPKDSYNCWGWGIYGDKVTRFSSYKEGIETVARGLKVNYIDKGYTTIFSIMRKYTPPSKGSWGRAVLKFFLMLEE